MKPAAFAYSAPRTVEEAVSLLEEHDYDAKLCGGGGSRRSVRCYCRRGAGRCLPHRQGIRQRTTAHP